MSQIISFPMRRTNAVQNSSNTYKIIGRAIFDQTNNLEDIDMYDFLTAMESVHQAIRQGHTQMYILVSRQARVDFSCHLNHSQIVDWQKYYPTKKTFVVTLDLCNLTIEIFDGIPEYGMDKPQ